MRPSKRRKIFHGVILALVVLLICFINSLLFLYQGVPWNQKLAAILMGRRPGSARPGTVLIHAAPSNVPGNGRMGGPRRQEALPTENQPPVRPIRVSFETFGKWKYIENQTPIPEAVKKFDGKMVEISGLMLSMNRVQNLDRFILVQSLWGCCFGQVPAPNHIIVVTLKPNRVVEYCPDPIRVTGTFSVGETREKGAVVSIYRMEAANVVVR